MSDRYDLVVDTGTDSTYIFSIVDSKGQAILTEGYTARMQIRPYLCADVVFDDNFVPEIYDENGEVRTPVEVIRSWELEKLVKLVNS